MKEEEKSIFPQKCQKIRGETTDCMMNSEGLKQGLKAFLTEFATCSKTGSRKYDRYHISGSFVVK